MLVSSLTAPANVRLPRIFSDGMVLQRNQKIPVWGWAKAGEKVTVHFRGQLKSVKADKNGKWAVWMDALPEGGPFDLVINGENTLKFSDVLVGEVWICSGQSNMEWPVRLSSNAEKEIKEGRYPQIRHFKVPNTTAQEPKDDLSDGNWVSASPENVGAFTAVGYFFARELFKELNVPVGLINSSWGGTDIETWISRPALEKSAALGPMMKSMPSVSNLESALKQRRQKVIQKLTELQGIIPKDSAAASIWKDPSFNDVKWPEIPVPGLWEQSVEDFDGVAWLRTSFNISPKDAGKAAELHLAMIDDSDISYVNGVKVGAMKNAYSAKRIYQIPAGLLKEGVNTIAVRVEDTGGGGGLYGNPDDLKLVSGDQVIKLGGRWKFQLESLMPDAGKSFNNPNSFPALLYNGMINPLIPYAFRGVIWYQGENNAGRAVEYGSAFPLMINDWRASWKHGDFPFYFVQLTSWIASGGNSNTGSQWAELREAQAQTLRLPNTGMAVTIDIGETGNIHPQNKQDVGKRLAAIALSQTYNKQVPYQGPSFSGIKIEGAKAVVSFNNTGDGLFAKDKYGYVRGFEIAGADQKFFYAKAFIEGDKIVLMNESVKEPAAVRYAWADDAGDANLYNKEGFPAEPFRSDKWKALTGDVKYSIK